MNQTPTIDDARTILTPHLGPHLRLSRILEGSDRARWFVNDDLVLRMAETPERTAGYDVDSLVREIVRAQVRITVPLTVARGEWAPGLGFLLDQRLPGASPEQTPVSPGGCLQLADFLQDMRAVALPLADVPTGAALDLAALADRAAAQLADVPAGLVDADALTGLEIPERSHADVLCHGQLTGEHVRVDRGGAVTGVIDWTAAMIAEPIVDIAGGAMTVGAGFACMIARQAGYDEATICRGIILARCQSVIQMAEVAREENDAPETLARHQLTRAWEASF